MVELLSGQAAALVVALPKMQGQAAVAELVAKLAATELVEVGPRNGWQWFADAAGYAAPLTVRAEPPPDTQTAFAEQLKMAEKALKEPCQAWVAVINNRSGKALQLQPTLWEGHAVLLAIGKPTASNWRYLPPDVEGARAEVDEQVTSEVRLAPGFGSEDVQPLASAAQGAWSAVAQIAQVAKDAADVATGKTFPWGLLAVGGLAVLGFAVFKMRTAPKAGEP